MDTLDLQIHKGGIVKGQLTVIGEANAKIIAHNHIASLVDLIRSVFIAQTQLLFSLRVDQNQVHSRMRP
jgi:hypothetical protein